MMREYEFSSETVNKTSSQNRMARFLPDFLTVSVEDKDKKIRAAKTPCGLLYEFQ
jgi:hypothetical protein